MSSSSLRPNRTPRNPLQGTDPNIIGAPLYPQSGGFTNAAKAGSNPSKMNVQSPNGRGRK